MLSKTRGIVLRNLDYSESSVISRIFTEEFGVQGYIIKGAKGKKAPIRPSHLMPLTLCELVVYHKPGSGLKSIKEFKISEPLQRLHFEVPRSSVAMFASDLISRAFSEEEHPDRTAFTFLHEFVLAVDSQTSSLPYLPIYLAYHLCVFLGFSPTDNSSDNTTRFEYAAGALIDDPIHKTKLELLERLDLKDIHMLSLSKDERAAILDALISFLGAHQPSIAAMQSHHVLREVFD